MKANIKYEFPCGYKYELDIQSGIFDIADIDDETRIKICPLHGKNCPPNHFWEYHTKKIKK